MSPAGTLLIFLDSKDHPTEWLHLQGGGIAKRDDALQGLPDLVDPATGDRLRIAIAVPGEVVSVHWIELPSGLAPAQALAAARIAAAEVSAQPVGDLHVAVGPEAEAGLPRAVVLVPALRMTAWLGRLQALGLDPDVVIPAPLLLTQPPEGFIRYDGGGLPLYRGKSAAFSLETELAGLIVKDAPVEMIDRQRFEEHLAAFAANPSINLRQGSFAKRKTWKISVKLLRRLSLLAMALLLATVAVQIASILRYSFAADAVEAEADKAAAAALGKNASAMNPTDQLGRQLVALRGNGAGYSALASALFSAVQITPNVELVALMLDRDGSMRTIARADSPATLEVLRQRIEARGFDVALGAIRNEGGQPRVEMVVRGQ